MDVDAHPVASASSISSSQYRGRQPYNESQIERHYLGNMMLQCSVCDALYFKSEQTSQKVFTKCCMKGKYIFDFNFDVPALLQQLVNNTHVDSREFRANIRQYNSSLAFASFSASVSAGSVPGRGPYSFRVQGIIHHLSSNLRVNHNSERKYAQLYFIDSAEANQCRITTNPNCSPSLLRALDNLMRMENAYARAFMNLREVEEREMMRCFNNPNTRVNYSVYLLKKPSSDPGRYNLPTCNEVAAVFSSIDGCPPQLRDVEIHNRDGRRMQLPTFSEHIDPMTYPLLYPYGTGGWSPDLKGKSGRKVTHLEYYSYLLSIRSVPGSPSRPIFLHCGKLTQQFIVDAYCKIEAGRLQYLRMHQKDLRVEYYRGLYDFVKEKAESKGYRVGKSVKLPSSFQGSPRHIWLKIIKMP